MARSRRKPYYKDKGHMKDDYWKVIRREWRQTIKSWNQDSDLQFRAPKTIINDYNYCDYWFIVEESPQSARGKWWSNHIGWTKKEVSLYSRK